MKDKERTQLIDFPEDVTTEYFENLGFKKVDAIKLKWKLRAKLRKEKEEVQAANARRELLKEKVYVFSPNANPNYILIDTCSLQFKEGKNIIDKSKKVVILESILKEWDKVLLKKKRVKRNKGDKYLMKNIQKYKREVAINSKYTVKKDTKDIQFNYCDDNILNFLEEFPEDNRPTLLTADINLVNRAKGYDLEYILILKHDQSEYNSKSENPDQENLTRIKQNKERIIKKEEKVLQFQGVSYKIEDENVIVKKFNPRAKVFIVLSEKVIEVNEMIKKQIVKLSEFSYIIILAKQKTNREVKGRKIVIVNGKFQYDDEKYEFLNDIYLSKILSEDFQEKAKKLVIA